MVVVVMARVLHPTPVAVMPDGEERTAPVVRISKLFLPNEINLLNCHSENLNNACSL